MFIHRMDPASMFKLKIWSSSPNFRKDSSYVIIKYIDKGTSNYKDFMDEFIEEHRMGLNESLKLSYFRTDLQKNVDVTNDQGMIDIMSTFVVKCHICSDRLVCEYLFTSIP
jgi:hypothetical protein